ncbi:MAG TPA: metalloregulator ArsR/SmtB family transcription factor [Phycisphaerae bacterium]|nr:metalloregulator ArsR/SmtB family transcription factor [Phycisphaerae bacterium]
MVAKRKKISPECLFRAFADPTRLRILHLLVPGELCVCDIVEVLRVPQPKISRHLAYLRRSGLVLARREGLWMHYRLAAARDTVHGKLLECLTCCFRDLPELSADATKMRLRRPERAAGCEAGDCCG